MSQIVDRSFRDVLGRFGFGVRSFFRSICPDMVPACVPASGFWERNTDKEMDLSPRHPEVALSAFEAPLPPRQLDLVGEDHLNPYIAVAYCEIDREARL